MKKGNVLAGEKQLDELRICVEKAFNKLRGRIDVDTAQGWIGNSEALDRWAEQLLPLEIALAESPLFEHMPDLDHKAFPGSLAFRFDDFFTTDRAIFSFVGPNAKEWFGGMEIPAASPSKLTLDWLTRAEYDPKIVETLGEENCDLSLGVLRWLFENDVFEKGRWYACYARDKNGVRCAFDWGWGGGGWRVGASAVPDPGGWGEGYGFVSRKSSATFPQVPRYSVT